MAAEAGTGPRASRAAHAGYAVRSMEQADVDPVARLHVRVWREAYASLMPAEHLAALDVEEFAERWRERLARPTADVRHVVGLDPEGRLVGVGSAGPGRDAEPTTSWELWALNVLASDHGTGLADLLIDALAGTGSCYLWVLRGNARAVAFYTRHGFVADGRTKLHPPTGLTEDRMVRIGSS